MTKCYLRWCYCSREEPWSPIQDKQALVMNASTRQLLTLCSSLPPFTHSGGTSGCVRSIWMEKAPREEANNGITNTRGQRITRNMMRPTSLLLQNVRGTNTYGIIHWQTWGDADDCQRNHPTFKQRTPHPSGGPINQSITKPPDFDLGHICINTCTFNLLVCMKILGPTKEHLHYNTDPTEPGRLISLIMWD